MMIVGQYVKYSCKAKEWIRAEVGEGRKGLGDSAESPRYATPWHSYVFKELWLGVQCL